MQTGSLEKTSPAKSEESQLLSEDVENRSPPLSELGRAE